MEAVCRTICSTHTAVVLSVSGMRAGGQAACPLSVQFPCPEELPWQLWSVSTPPQLDAWCRQRWEYHLGRDEASTGSGQGSPRKWMLQGLPAESVPSWHGQKLGEVPSCCQRRPTLAAPIPWGSCERWHTAVPHLPVAELSPKCPASPVVPEGSGRCSMGCFHKEYQVWLAA